MLAVYDLPAALALGVGLVAASALSLSTSPTRQIITVLVVVSATTTLPQQVHIGPITGLGALTILFLLAFGLQVFVSSSEGVRLPSALGLLLVWALVVTLLTGVPAVIGFQNLMLLALFAAVYVATARLVRSEAVAAIRAFDMAFCLAGWLCATVYGVSVLVDGLGTSQVVESRSVALFALPVFGWALSGWRVSRQSRLLTAVLAGTIVASLSRGALGAAAAMTAMAWFDLRNPSGWIKAVAVSGFSVLAVSLSVAHVPGLYNRFYAGDVQSVGFGITVNTSGRETIWRPVWQQALRSPVIGSGPGTADALTASLSGRTAGNAGGAGNVHNDYLRLFHDYGIVGLGLWIATIVQLASRLLGGPSDARRWRLAAGLALAGVSLEMFVDNPFIELDVMGPLAVLLGGALALPQRSAVVEPAASRHSRPPALSSVR